MNALTVTVCVCGTAATHSLAAGEKVHTLIMLRNNSLDHYLAWHESAGPMFCKTAACGGKTNYTVHSNLETATIVKWMKAFETRHNAVKAKLEDYARTAAIPLLSIDYEDFERQPGLFRYAASALAIPALTSADSAAIPIFKRQNSTHRTIFGAQYPKVEAALRDAGYERTLRDELHTVQPIRPRITAINVAPPKGFVQNEARVIGENKQR